jgi:hypothetical protein
VDWRDLRRLLRTSLLILLVGSFDELAIDEESAGPNERHEVECIVQRHRPGLIR